MLNAIEKREALREQAFKYIGQNPKAKKSQVVNHFMAIGVPRRTCYNMISKL